MRVRVRLYGTLRRDLPSDQRREGVDVEIAQGATAEDLLGLLGISDSRGIVLVVEGRVLAADEVIRAEATVNVFQAIGGG